MVLAAVKDNRENSAEVKQLPSDISIVTIKAGERISAPTASLELAGKKIGELKKERNVAI